MAAPFIHPWPSRAHRTLAQVDETERLQKMLRAEVNKRGLSVRFENLLRKATTFNPPPAAPERGDAA